MSWSPFSSERLVFFLHTRRANSKIKIEARINNCDVIQAREGHILQE